MRAGETGEGTAVELAAKAASACALRVIRFLVRIGLTSSQNRNCWSELQRDRLTTGTETDVATRDRDMNPHVIMTLSISAVSSATGMILFRYGGRGNTTLAEFFNVYILLGCIVYLVGAVAGLYSLSKVSAAQAYPFTVLHAVLLYAYSSLLLGEKLTPPALFGCGLILAGLFLVIHSPN